MKGIFVKTSTVDIHTLKSHPDHDYYCGNIPEKNWADFKKSVRMFGADKIIISKDMTVISGWQRVKACRELGRRKIAADIYEYNSPDDIIEDMVMTHIWQHMDKRLSGKEALAIGKYLNNLSGG